MSTLGPVSKARAYVDAAAAMRAAADALGLRLTGPALALLLGQAFGESQFGRIVAGYRSTLRGSNNYGAVDSTKAWEARVWGRPGFGKLAHLDTLDGTPSTGYVAWFRVLPSQYEGALGFLRTAMYGNASGFVASLDAGPDTYANWLKARGYYGVDAGSYARMLAANAAEASAALSAGASMQPAEPHAFTAGDFLPLAARFAARPDLAARVAGDGVVWLGPPGIDEWIAGPAVLLAAGALLVAWESGWLPRALRRIAA